MSRRAQFRAAALRKKQQKFKLEDKNADLEDERLLRTSASVSSLPLPVHINVLDTGSLSYPPSFKSALKKSESLPSFVGLTTPKKGTFYSPESLNVIEEYEGSEIFYKKNTDMLQNEPKNTEESPTDKPVESSTLSVKKRVRFVEEPPATFVYPNESSSPGRSPSRTMGLRSEHRSKDVAMNNELNSIINAYNTSMYGIGNDSSDEEEVVKPKEKDKKKDKTVDDDMEVVFKRRSDGSFAVDSVKIRESPKRSHRSPKALLPPDESDKTESQTTDIEIQGSGNSLPLLSIRIAGERGFIMKHVEYCVTYRVFSTHCFITDVNLQKNESMYYVVNRRYSQFLWLWEYLTRKYPKIKLPPMPEKGGIIGRFEPEFLENRRKGLEHFMRSLLAHAELSRDLAVNIFLQSTEEDWFDNTKHIFDVTLNIQQAKLKATYEI